MDFTDPIVILLIGMVAVVGLILFARLHAFFALIVGALLVSVMTSPDDTKAYLQRAVEMKRFSQSEADAIMKRRMDERLAAAFGKTCGDVGLMIAMASVIGACLLESGAADRLVRAMLRLLGEERAPIGFMATGFFLGIPVFFDVVFFLMIPIGRALALRTGRNYLLYILTICCGATMSHSLVPPTPGPLKVAAELKITMGSMMLGGIVIGLIASIAGYFYAHLANRLWKVEVRDEGMGAGTSKEAPTPLTDAMLPPTWLSILPLALPIVLIGGQTIFEQMETPIVGQDGAGLMWAKAHEIGMILGSPNISLLISTFVAMFILIYWRRDKNVNVQTVVQSGITSGASVMVITAAGGAFGNALTLTGVGERIRELAAHYQVEGIGILALAWGVTALIRAAQGSATVAMITAAGIFVEMASAEKLGFSPIYLALAIGSGSKPGAWMNDSGFWTICKITGMNEVETLRTFSLLLTFMGIVGLCAVLIGASVFPMR